MGTFHYCKQSMDARAAPCVILDVSQRPRPSIARIYANCHDSIFGQADRMLQSAYSNPRNLWQDPVAPLFCLITQWHHTASATTVAAALSTSTTSTTTTATITTAQNEYKL